MFGYIYVNEQELKLREYTVYRSFYCGLCRELYLRFGRSAQLVLNYDLTFLAILLTGLYEPETVKEKRRCVLHPLKQHESVSNDAIRYAADMCVLLAYQKALDDWEDERKPTGRALAALLKSGYQKICAAYPRQARAVEENIRLLHETEKKKAGEEKTPGRAVKKDEAKKAPGRDAKKAGVEKASGGDAKKAGAGKAPGGDAKKAGAEKASGGDAKKAGAGKAPGGDAKKAGAGKTPGGDTKKAGDVPGHSAVWPADFQNGSGSGQAAGESGTAVPVKAAFGEESGSADRAADIDYVAGLTGNFLAEMFVWKDDIWQEDLRQIGFYLGKFVYLMDAVEDVDRDRKHGNYNVFSDEGNVWESGREHEIRAALTGTAAEAARAFERLPVLQNAGILRNILYSGIWCRYAALKKKAEKTAGRRQ